MKDILIGILLIASIGQWLAINKLERKIANVSDYNIKIRLTQFDLEDAFRKTQYSLDSLTKAVNNPIVEAKKKKLFARKKKSKAEIAKIETIIFTTLIDEGVDSTMAKTIVAIGRHESGNFNSGLFRDTYNIFGMTYPPKRPTLANGFATYLDNGNQRRFCKFKSPAESAKDFVLYLNHWNYSLKIQTPDTMVRTMKSKRYFEANEKIYLKAVKRHMAQLSI